MYFRTVDRQRQMPIVNVQRRVEGNLVYGTVNEVTNENGETKPPQFNIPGAVAAPSDALLESIGSLEVSSVVLDITFRNNYGNKNAIFTISIIKISHIYIGRKQNSRD